MTNKRCSDDGHIGPRYLPVTEFHKQGTRNGKQMYNSRCKECKNRLYREQYAIDKRGQDKLSPEKRKAYSRARSKALTKLSRVVPELYATILDEELDREERETGISFTERGIVRNSLRKRKRK